MATCLSVIFAYLFGSVPTGYILGSLAGVDVRKAGSGNVGATNVARVVGKRHGIFTLVADIVKGLVPVVIALHLGLTSTATALVGVVAFLGHLYSVFNRTEGRKMFTLSLDVVFPNSPSGTLVSMRRV